VLLTSFSAHEDRVHAIQVFVAFVEAQFILEKKSDKNDNRKADSQAENIDKRVAFVPLQIPDRYF
jgi:hypothetical protein